MHQTLAVYRQWLREVRKLKVPPIQRKLRVNFRQAIETNRGQQALGTSTKLQEQAQAALRVVQWLRQLPQVLPNHNLIASASSWAYKLQKAKLGMGPSGVHGPHTVDRN